ncbi:hypothetical protein BH11CYA1_BH11CYA1_03210 [soil metagenome]
MAWANKIVGAAFLVSALAAAWARLPLTFDGSYYLINLLESRQLVAPHGRLTVALLTLPAQIIVRLTESLEATTTAFCLTYALIPFISILACWLIVRKTQIELMIWPIISIGLLSAASQTNQLSENLIACQLAWPLLLNVLTNKGRLATTLSLLFAGFLILLHPVSIVFLGIASVASFLVRERGQRAALIYTLGLLALALCRLAQLLFTSNDYEQAMLKSTSLLETLRTGYSGLILPITFVSLWLVLVQLRTPLSIKFQRLWLVGTAALPLLAGVLIIIWSNNLRFWYQCLPSSRFLFVPITVLMLYATYEKLTEPKSFTFKDGRIALSCAIAIIFASATLVQSFKWSACTGKLQAELLNSKETTINIEDLQWLRGTPLNHWSVVPLAIILQGRTPKTILLTAEARKQIDLDGTFKTVPWEGKFTNYYFKLPDPTSNIHKIQSNR